MPRFTFPTEAHQALYAALQDGGAGPHEINHFGGDAAFGGGVYEGAEVLRSPGASTLCWSSLRVGRVRLTGESTFQVTSMVNASEGVVVLQRHVFESAPEAVAGALADVAACVRDYTRG